jgi:hypothetical protein
MNYQLVFQFEANTIAEFNFLSALEQYLTEALEGDDDAFVDGHDFGMGEYNIFIHTNEPLQIFEKVGELIGKRNPELPFCAGYRSFDEDIYSALWPQSAANFSVA